MQVSTNINYPEAISWKWPFYSNLVEAKTFDLNEVADDNYHPQIEELLLEYLPDDIVVDQVGVTSFTTIDNEVIEFDLHD